MKSVLLSPHDDDAHLFAAYTLMREKPTVLVCLDSYIQPNRGEFGCSAEERAQETDEACAITGNDVLRAGIHDDLDKGPMLDALGQALTQVNPDIVYAPANQGGNLHHDLVNYMATILFTVRVIEYPTYTRDQLYTTGTHEIIPTNEERYIKASAMNCYKSQIRINRPHFDAVNGKSEWLNRRGNKTLHLGCGNRVIPGWTNLDRMPGADVQADILLGIPFPDDSFDYVISEDFLEHLPAESAVFVMNEIWRVLENGGTMEHFVPNAGSRNDFGSPTHLSHWNGQTFEHFNMDSPRWEKDRHFEGTLCKFRKQKAQLINWQKEEDGATKPQALHVKYQAVK